MNIENIIYTYSLGEIFNHYLDLPKALKMIMGMKDLSSAYQRSTVHEKFGSVSKGYEVITDDMYGYELMRSIQEKEAEIGIDPKDSFSVLLAKPVEPLSPGYKKYSIIREIDQKAVELLNSKNRPEREFMQFLILEVIPYKFDTYGIAHKSLYRSEITDRIMLGPLTRGILRYMNTCRDMDDPAVTALIAELIQNFHKIVYGGYTPGPNIFTAYVSGYSDKIAQDILTILNDAKNTNGFDEDHEKLLVSARDRFEAIEATLYNETWTHPPYFENEDVLIDGTERLINLFGDNIFEDRDLNAVKEDLRHLNRENVQSYLPEELNGPVSFDIDPNSKMYLKDELQCKIMIAQINRGDQIDEVTIINYEGDTFVLFKTKADETLILGISMSFAGIKPSRKLITIYNDDELDYRFIPEI